MSVQVEKTENSMATLTIEVEAEEFDRAVQKVYQRQKNRISVPGFRKGKAPRKMIEKLYGAGIFFEDAANDAIREAYPKAAAETGLEIVSWPEFGLVQIEPGLPFIFTAEVALKPPVELGAYKGIEVAKQVVEVTEEDIDKEINKERENNARTVSVEDRAVMDKDSVRIDFEGFLDGVPFEGGAGKDYDLEIGSHTFIDTFEEQLIGKNIGEETEVAVTFPENYHEERLAGQPVIFKVTIHEIRMKEYPELDDDFAKDVSEFDTFAEYREDVRKTLLEKKEEDAKFAKENEVIGKIVENAKLEIPKAMLETQTEKAMEDFSRRIARQGLSMEMYMQLTGMDEEQLTAQMRPETEKKIKNRLVMEAVAEAENLKATEEQIEQELEKMSQAYGLEVSRLKDTMTEEDRKQIEADCAVEMAIDFVRDAAKETE